MKAYNAGVIGLGNIGFLLGLDPKRKGTWSHSHAFMECERMRFAGAVDIDLGKRKEFKKHFPEVPVYETIDELFTCQNIDLVSICTPTETHFDVFSRVIKYSVKAVFCEKPLTRTTLTARKIINLARRKEVLVALNHTRRWQGIYKHAASIIQEGRIGKIRVINAFYPGQVCNIGSHLFDTIRMIIGKNPLVICGVFVNSEEPNDPSISGSILFSEGIFCSFSATGKREDLIFEIDVIGDEGRVQVLQNGMEIKYFRFMESKNYLGYRELQQKEIIDAEPGDMLLEAVYNIADTLDGKRELSCIDIDGYWTLEIIEKAIESANGANEYRTVQDPSDLINLISY